MKCYAQKPEKKNPVYSKYTHQLETQVCPYIEVFTRQPNFELLCIESIYRLMGCSNEIFVQKV